MPARTGTRRRGVRPHPPGAGGPCCARTRADTLTSTTARRSRRLVPALLDAGIPGVSLPDAIPTDPERAWKTWHFAFHLVRDLPETLLTVPVLGVSSSHGSIPDMAATLTRWAPGATGVVIPDAGRFIPDEQPAAVVDTLTAFVDHGRARLGQA